MTYPSARAFVVFVLAIFVPAVYADDIAGSFSSVSNPNGPWSYGSYVEGTATFSPFSVHNAFGGATCGLPNWSGAGGYPAVIANNTGATVACGSWTLPTDTLNLHPTNTAGTDADVRWTAPASGTYVISGSFLTLDSTTTLDSILVNGTSVFSVHNSGAFSLTEVLTVGSHIDFTVNCCSGSDQDFFFDSTGLDGTISVSSPTTVPEPSSLLLFGTGLAGLVGAIRRKRW